MRTLVRELAGIAGAANVESPVPRAALRDATEAQAYAGRADALVRPGSADEVAAVVAWCYEHDVADRRRAAAASGFAGGAVP